MTEIVVGLVFLATLAAIRHLHTSRRRDRTNAARARADFDAEWTALAEKNRALVEENWTLRRLLAEQCRHTREWKAVAAAQFDRVIELRTAEEADARELAPVVPLRVAVQELAEQEAR